MATLNQIRTQHVNMTLYPANIWVEEIRYHPTRSSVCRSARGGITDAIAIGSMAKLTSLLTLFRELFAVVGWNPALEITSNVNSRRRRRCPRASRSRGIYRNTHLLFIINNCNSRLLFTTTIN